MSLITIVGQLVDWFHGRPQTHGGDSTASVESVSEPKEELAVREVAQQANRIEPQAPPTNDMQFLDWLDEQDTPDIEVHPTVFNDGLVFTDERTVGSWILADRDSVIEWGEKR